MSSRFEFNNAILSEFSDSEVRNMSIAVWNAIDVLYTLSDMASELGDFAESSRLDNLAFYLRYVVPSL